MSASISSNRTVFSSFAILQPPKTLSSNAVQSDGGHGAVALQMGPSGTDRGRKRKVDALGDGEAEQPALKRRLLSWPQRNHSPDLVSGHPADTSIFCSSSVDEPLISDGGSPANSTSAPISGEGFTTPENDENNGEDGDQHLPLQQPFSITSQHSPASGAPRSTGMRPRAPPNPPSLPKPRRRVDPRSFTLTPLPQGDVLQRLTPPEEPTSLKDKITTAATIIGRSFTKAEMNWVMATLWPDTVHYLGKGEKKRGQAVRPPNL